MNEKEQYLRRNIGRKIKLARTKAEYTQEKLAEKLSLSTRYISQLERGIAFGSATTITNLCKALNISSDFLFNDLIDDRLLENYLKLNKYNKEVLCSMSAELLKLQGSHARSFRQA